MVFTGSGNRSGVCGRETEVVTFVGEVDSFPRTNVVEERGIIEGEVKGDEVDGNKSGVEVVTENEVGKNKADVVFGEGDKVFTSKLVGGVNNGDEVVTSTVIGGVVNGDEVVTSTLCIGRSNQEPS